MSAPIYFTDTNNSVVAIAANTLKTPVAVWAAADFGIQLVKYRVAFDGVTASAVPALVRVYTSTNQGTGTAGTSTQTGGGPTLANGCTAKYNLTVEPTGKVYLDTIQLTPNGGLVIYDYPPGTEATVQALNGGIGIDVLTPAAAPSVNVTVGLWYTRV